MKKFKRIAISLLLLIAITVSFASCEYVDKAKEWIDQISGKVDETPDTTVDTLPPDNNEPEEPKLEFLSGEEYFRKDFEFYWLDTYEEVLAAIELLESHGSTVNRNIISTYESEQIDSKYLFLCAKKNAEPLEEGKDFFDRKMDDSCFLWYGFYDELTLEYLMEKTDYVTHAKKYMYIRGADVYEYWIYCHNVDFDLFSTISDPSDIKFMLEDESLADTIGYYMKPTILKYNEVDVLSIWVKNSDFKGDADPFLPVECQREFIESLVIIE